MNQWIPHVTVAAVVDKIIDGEQRFLMVEETIHNTLVINQPAGHWEMGESLIEAVQRETLEETSYIVKAESLIGIYNWTIPQHENAALSTDTFLRFTFKSTLLEKTEQSLDQDINRFLWLTENEIRSTEHQKRSPLVLRSLDDFLAGNSFPLTQFIDIK